MAINYPLQGEFNTSAYTISATPFVTSSTITLGEIKEINFGYVSRFFSVKNTSPGTVISVGFSTNGLKPKNSNFFFLSGSQDSGALELRADKIFISGSSGNSIFTITAGLTTIASKFATPLTSSMGFTGIG